MRSSEATLGLDMRRVTLLDVCHIEKEQRRSHSEEKRKKTFCPSSTPAPPLLSRLEKLAANLGLMLVIDTRRGH